MKYCEKCKVQVVGKRERCPLCQNELICDGKDTEEVFPYVPTIYEKYKTAFKIMILVSVAAIVVSFAVNLMFPVNVWWAWIVTVAIGCFWVAFYIAFTKRKNIPKNLLYQVILVSVMVVLWDRMGGFGGWSVDFVIPILCMVNLLVLFILSKVMHIDAEDYMIYMLVSGVFGIVPVLFYIFGILKVLFPSVLCVASSIIFLAAVLIFQGDKILDELRRRLHY